MGLIGTLLIIFLCASWAWAGTQLSVVGSRWSVIGGRWSVVGCQWSRVNGQRTADGEPTTDNRPPTTEEPANMEPAQVHTLLRRVYVAAYRVSDLLTLLQPEKWSMEEAARQSFNQTLESVRAQLKTLEQWRLQFDGQPDNLHLGDETDSAISALLAGIEAVARAVSQYESPSSGAQFRQPADQLLELQKALKSYLSFLRFKAQQGQPIAAQAKQGQQGQPALQTEQVSAPPPPALPLTTVSTEKPPLDPAQLKAFLYKIYVPAFRIQDLLSQQHPERWQASDAERNAFSQAREKLQSKLAELERWRMQFGERPNSMDSAFQTYVALGGVLRPLEVVSRSVAQYQDPKLGAEYQERGSQLAALQQDLVPYISFLLRNQDKTVQMFESNLAACQNQLGYAMRSKLEPATRMININPVFQGHRRKKVDGRQ